MELLLGPFAPETSVAGLKGVRQDLHFWRIAALPQRKETISI